MNCQGGRRRCLQVFLLAALCCLSVTGSLVAAPAPVTVAVAANALAPLQRISAQFQRDTGIPVRLVAGSTGALYAQIRQGAPYDLFLAADTTTPARLEKQGLLVPGSRFVYARGQLVLWSRDPARVDAGGAVLSQGEGLRLAIAHPERAPYGAAALAVLEALGLRQAWEDRLVYGESVGKTWQFVASGNADLGFVAASQVQTTELGSRWPVPASLHPPLDQGAGLLTAAQDKAEVRAFHRYLCAAEARAVFRTFGYLPGDCRAID